MTPAQLERARRLLCSLQNTIRDTVINSRKMHARRFATVSGITSADTIYHIDRISEAAVVGWFERTWPRNWPVELVMEGLAGDGTVTFPRGTAVAETVFKCIIDPIDGTRGIMYDKRSAWILAGLAPQKGPRTDLSDIFVAAMTELPTTKQMRADQFSAVRGCGRSGVVARGFDLRAKTWTKLTVAPSRAEGFEHGFASLVKFFPSGKKLTAEIEEKLWAEVIKKKGHEELLVFDDQYISTGGQLYEMLMGHDRMIGDLRPLVFAKLKLRSALTCHPYDICTALIFTEAGGIIEAPNGRKLSAPLDTTSAIAWIAYANPTLAGKIRPILRRLLKRYLS